MKFKSKPLETIDSATAQSSLTGVAWYPQPNKDSERLSPYPNIAHTPKFKIPNDGKIFAIGSCFAREIEKAMVALGMNVVSYQEDANRFGDKYRYITNKYTPPSILHDLQLATGGYTEKNINDSVVQVDSIGRRFANYQFGGGDALKTQARDDVVFAYKKLLENLSQISECNLVVITLGLVEAWFDKKTKTYFNIGPHRSALKHSPERFELHVLSYEQIMESLEGIYKILKETAKVEQNVLVTVSPVPLHATHRDQDVLQANCYSKSVLRTAVESFVIKHNELSYFPSYEMVTLADLSKAWGDKDYRHVSSLMVSKIMEASVNSYLDVQIPSREKLRNLILAKSYREVVDLVEAIELPEHRLRVYINYYAAVAYWNLKKKKNCADNLEIVLKHHPVHFSALVLRARVMVEDKKTKEAIKLLSTAKGKNAAADKLLAELLRTAV